MSKILRYYLPVFLWCGLIFFLSSRSSLPGPSSAIWDFVFKKSAHMFVYGVLYFLLFRAVNADRKYKTYLLPLLLGLLYAATDEFHQSFIPTRTPSVRDMGYDLLGMVVVLLRLKGFV